MQEDTGIIFLSFLIGIVLCVTLFVLGYESGIAKGTDNTYQSYCDTLKDYDYTYGKVGEINTCVSKERYQVIGF